MTTPHAFFLENIRLFATPVRKDPEKYNLYAGLAALAKMVEDNNRKLRDIEHRLVRIEKHAKG